MAHYSYTITEFNGTTVPTANMRRAQFINANSPAQTRRFQPVEASVIGLGDRDVRAQPTGTFWEIHVELIAVAQTDLDALYAIFDEEAGLVTLKATDGDSAVWKVEARVVQVQRKSETYFVIVLRVADPTWEENSLTTDAQSNQSGDDFNLTLTNNGQRKARPIVSVHPDSVKTSDADDYKVSTRGFVVNRSAKSWNNLPVVLTDISGSDVPIVHDSLVIDTTRAAVVGALSDSATSITYDTITNGGLPTKGMALLLQARGQINESGGIDETQTTIIYNTGVNGNPPAAGVVLMGVELIRYTGGGGGSTGTLTGCVRGYANTVATTHTNGFVIAVLEQISFTAGGGASPGTLTGVVRGIGGTLALAHSDNTSLLASNALVNGDDIRVWVNGSEVERWLGGVLGPTMRVFANLSMPPATRVQLTPTLLDGLVDGNDLVLDAGIEDLPDVGILAFDDELVSYTSRDVATKTLGNIERGAWGTSNATHSVTPERADLNGSLAAGAASIPYDGGRNGLLPTEGALIYIGDEQILSPNGGGGLSSGTLVNCIRGVNNTQDVAHDDNVAILVPHFGYLVSKLFVISAGKSSAGTPPAPLATKPCIGMNESLKTIWRWAVEDDFERDPAFFDPANPNRTAAWRPDTEVDPADQNNAQLLRLEDSISRLSFRDSDPVVGRPPISRLLFDHPSGITLLSFHAQKRSDIRLRVLGRTRGVEFELYDLQDRAEASETVVAQSDERIDGLVLNGVRASVCGADDESIPTIYLSANGETFAQRFFLDQDTVMETIQLRLKKEAGGDSYGFSIQIYDDSGGGVPAAGRQVVNFGNTNGGAKVDTAAELTTSYALYEYEHLTKSLPLLVAGAYWIVLKTTSYSSGRLYWSAGLPLGKHQPMFYESAGPLIGGYKAFWFRVNHLHGGPVQENAEILNGDSEADFTDFAILMAAGEYPWVHRTASLTNSLYHCVGVLVNSTTGDQLAIDKWMAADSILEIDTELRRVRYIEGNMIINVPAAVVPSNLADWLPLDPGANSLTYSEPNMVSTDLTSTFRGKKV